MSTRDIASLAFKLAGIYSLIQAIALLPPLLSLPAWDLGQMVEPTVNVPLLVLGHLVPIVILACLGLYLIFGSRSLARATVRGVEGSKGPVQPFQIHAVLFSVVGALLIGLASKSVPHIFQNIAILLHDWGTPGSEERRQDFIRDNWQWASGICLQLVIGVGLLFWSKRIAGVFHRTAIPEEARRHQQHCPYCGQPFFADDYRAEASTRLCSRCTKELPSEMFTKGHS